MNLRPIGVLDILKRIDEGSLSPARAIDEAREAVAALDGAVGAFTRLAPAAPLEDDVGWASGPLEGITLAVKDIFDTADIETEYGSAIYRGFRPRADAALVALSRASGAMVLGKSATTEFATMTPCATRNPHDLRHTPGGSSSGSAAAVAAGMVAGALGSQTGGSVIRPAAFCGVAGFKPSYRLLPTVGMKTVAWTLDTAGLFAASVPDVAALAAIIAERPLFVPGTPPVPLRVGLYRSRVDDRLDPEMVQAWSVAARCLEKGGARLTEIAEPEPLARGREAQKLIQTFESAVALSHERLTHRDMLSAQLAATLDEGAAIAAATYDDARRHARRARKEMSLLFQEVDVLLAPSALGAAPAGLASTGDPLMNRLWTLTGCPCVNVPGLRDEKGLPLGVSIVARFGDDAGCLAAAAHLERLLQRR